MAPDATAHGPDDVASPHQTSLAVWAVPATVAAGKRFAVKVGAKSSTGCALAGRSVEVRDDAGALVGAGCLGEAPWPGTDALFWADVEIAAPRAAGLAALSARFDATGLDQPHQDAAAAFSVAVVAPPEHKVIVKVAAAGAPIEQAHIRLGPYRAVTDAAGRAEIAMAKGRYQLVVWKAGYDTPATPVEIAADASIAIEAIPQPEDHPDAGWTA